MAVADVVIKQEAVDAVDLEERVVELCKANPKGITDQLISQDMPNIPPQQRVTAINRLLSMVGLRSSEEIQGLKTQSKFLTPAVLYHFF